MTESELPFRLLTPDGRWAVEVSQPNGKFLVQVILDGTTVTESLETEDSDKVLQWAKRQMREVMRRTTGDHGT
jgi:hypothetical protein